MARGRPTTSEQVLLEYTRSRGDRSLDRQLDADAISTLARERGLERFDFASTLKRMRRKGLAYPIQSGRWVLTPDGKPRPVPRIDHLESVAEMVLRRLDMPYCVSWHAALWHYGLVDQQSRRVSVAVMQRKRPVVVGMSNIRFVTVIERKFFGRVRIENMEWPVWMATPEKALLDSFERPELAAPMAVVANALREAYQIDLLDPDVLVSDALQLDSPHLNRRVGFFMEMYGIPGWEPLALRVGRKHAIPLSPRSVGGEAGLYPVNPRWRVYEDPMIVGAAEEPK